MRKEYKDGSLFLISLDQFGHSKTCNYWFLIQHNAMSYTAFETFEGLSRWMAERGLNFSKTAPEKGVFSTQALIGGFAEEMHYTPDELIEWASLEGHETKILSNARYTKAIITADQNGGRVVHYLNPNCDRVEYDYWEASKEMR